MCGVFMKEYLYRYISFEKFVGMIQNQALTFVAPDMWEDPKESSAFNTYLNSIENTYEKLFLQCIYNKTYGQCWTKLAESDAMWRIYSYNNKALRIKVSKNKITLLENVDVVDINYTDNVFDGKNRKNGKQLFLETLSQKRLAFEHEQEVRLISLYQYKDDDDIDKNIKAMLVVCRHPQSFELLDSMFPDTELEQQVEQAVILSNVGKNYQSTKNISFKHISNFIEGVMVHPQAPDWYTKIVEDFCKLNNIVFEGKSSLYST